MAGSVTAQSVTVSGLGAVVERGTYHNYFSCQYPAYAIFAYLGDDSGADSRLGQFLVGWDTASAVPTNQPVTRYLIRSAQVSVTINDGNQVIYDPTHDAVATYFNTNNPARTPDLDAGRPIELFGVGYRQEYGQTNFLQCSTVGNGAVTNNNVYPLCWTTNGQSRDVSNNVGKTNDYLQPFETWPFAVAQAATASVGGTLSPGELIYFDLDLRDPFIMGYVRRALRQGRLDLMVSSLHQVSGQFGTEPYPSFATRFNQALLEPPTTLALEVTVVRDLDADSDGLPDDWEQFYFSSLTNVATGDFDQDGASNQAELLADTDPAQANSGFHLTYRRLAQNSELRWPNLPNRRFEVEFSGDLTTWHTLTNPALFYPAAQEVRWAETTNVSARYFRVKAVVE